MEVTRRTPDSTTRTLSLNQTSPGLGLGVIDVDKPGLYRFDDGTLRTVVAVGNPDPLELVVHTDEPHQNKDVVGCFLEAQRFKTTFFSDAVLGLSYDPSTESYPTFPLTLDRT